MKKIITLLALLMFASAELTFAAVTVAPASSTATTSIVTAETSVTQKQTVKEWVKATAKDLSQRQIIAAVLAFFFGVFGIHNFYLGRKKQAIWQLILGLLVVTAPISAIWSLVDLVRILMGKLG